MSSINIESGPQVQYTTLILSTRVICSSTARHIQRTGMSDSALQSCEWEQGVPQRVIVASSVMTLHPTLTIPAGQRS